MIELIEGLPEGVVGLEAVGEVTSEDYETVAMPAIEGEKARREKLRLLYVLGSRFDGYTAGHYRTLIKGFGWLIPGEVKLFSEADLDDAKAWVSRL
jgi:hypothetical protein